MRLAAATWPEVEPARWLLAVPVGSCEQHGPHLPLDTDTRIAVAVAERLAERRPDVAVAPPVAYGSSGEHAGFAGTLSIGQQAVELVLVELVRSAEAWRGVVLVNGHGGNAEPVARAVARSVGEQRRVLAWWPHLAGADLHAGRTETSLLLALAPELVRHDRLARGADGSLAELLPDLRARGVRAVSANGVLGDPTGASASEGHRLLDELTGDLTAAVTDWAATLPAAP